LSLQVSHVVAVVVVGALQFATGVTHFLTVAPVSTTLPVPQAVQVPGTSPSQDVQSLPVVH